jgi:hypothetical protein
LYYFLVLKKVKKTYKFAAFADLTESRNSALAKGFRKPLAAIENVSESQ